MGGEAKSVPVPNQAKPQKQSLLFDGASIFERLNNSSFGRFRGEVAGLVRLEDFDLPRVVVIGGESAGKSSLLENVTKCAVFPRDSDICTRAPVCLKLEHVDSAEKGGVSISFRGQQHLLSKTDDILGKVEELMRMIPNEEITEDELSICISETNIPTFEFVDLPGIRTYPPVVAARTENLVRKYLSNPDVLVLCTVPATTPRLTSDKSFALVQQLGKAHQTIISLTRTDLVHSADFATLVTNRVLRTSSEFTGVDIAGCVAIVNRTHDDTFTLRQCDELEHRYFEMNVAPLIRDQPEAAQCMTLSRLVEKMDHLYDAHIRKAWKPKAVARLQELKNSTECKLINLGPDPKLLTTEKVLNAVACGIPTIRVSTDLLWEDGTPVGQKLWPDDILLSWGTSLWAGEMQKLQESGGGLATYLAQDPFLQEIRSAVADGFAADCPMKLRRFGALKTAILGRLTQAYTARVKTITPKLERLMTTHLDAVYSAVLTSDARRIRKQAKQAIIGCLLAEVVLPLLANQTLLSSGQEKLVEDSDWAAQREAEMEQASKLERALKMIANW